MTKYTFRLKLVSGDVDEWKRFSSVQTIEKMDDYKGKNTRYVFDGDTKFVTVEFETIVDLFNTLLKVGPYYQLNGFTQKVEEFLSPQNGNILKELKQIREVLHA